MRGHRPRHDVLVAGAEQKQERIRFLQYKLFEEKLVLYKLGVKHFKTSLHAK